MSNDYNKEEVKDYVEDPLYKISLENNKLEQEVKNLKRTVEFYQTELEKFRTLPYLVSEVSNVIDNEKYVVKLPNQSTFLVQKSGDIKTKIEIGDLVLCEQRSLVIMDKLDIMKNYSVENYVILNKPETSWTDIGGLSEEILKLQEVLELPMKKPEVFKKIGIEPPKGILLHGPPGTGKTMLAKALAKETNSTFIEIVGSELVQKYIGEGAKLVKDMFDYARSKAPAIIFIDEVDAIAAKRIENGTSGEREVQRTFMQLLAEIDGFKNLDDVKIIAATNRIDVLDEAIVRPGRLERKIEVKEPDREGIKEIFKIHSKKMPLESDVNEDKICDLADGFSGAEIKSLITEAGYIAIREGKEKVDFKNFEDAKQRVRKTVNHNLAIDAMYN